MNNINRLATEAGMEQSLKWRDYDEWKSGADPSILRWKETEEGQLEKFAELVIREYTAKTAE
jgi:hypothetical protein